MNPETINEWIAHCPNKCVTEFVLWDLYGGLSFSLVLRYADSSSYCTNVLQQQRTSKKLVRFDLSTDYSPESENALQNTDASEGVVGGTVTMESAAVSESREHKEGTGVFCDAYAMESIAQRKRNRKVCQQY